MKMFFLMFRVENSMNSMTVNGPIYDFCCSNLCFLMFFHIFWYETVYFISIFSLRSIEPFWTSEASFWSKATNGLQKASFRRLRKKKENLRFSGFSWVFSGAILCVSDVFRLGPFFFIR